MVSFFKSKSKKPKKRFVKAKAKGKKSTFAKRVQAVISKNVETKTVYQANTNQYYNASITSAADIIQILPNCVNGTTDHSRIGDTIRGQRLRIKGFLSTQLNVTGASNCRIGVRMMIVQPKQFSDYTYVLSQATTWLTSLLKRGSTTVAFTGLPQDLFSDINREAITCYYDKVMYFQSPYLLTAAGDVSVHNSTRFFNINLNLRNKILKYDNDINAGLTPVNFNPVLILGYVKLDGSAPDILVQLQNTTDSYLDYEDA